MKKITLNESDPMKNVNKVLNEQKIRQFNEDQIELLHFIFERELKPPFRKGEMDKYGDYPYYNRDGEHIGWLDSRGYFKIRAPFWPNIGYKVCQVFGFSYDTYGWWLTTKPHLKYWMEDKLSIEINALEVTYI